MTPWSLVRRGVRALFGWWWQSARPSVGASLAGSGEARPAHVAGRPPLPEERWQPSSEREPTGPWADVEPHTTGRWPRRGSLLTLAAWAGLVALRVRRDLRATAGAERTDFR